MTPPEQHWDPTHYAEHAHFVADHGAPVLDWLAPKPGERILDLGCGDGVLSAQLAERGCHVLGVDASTEMVAAARARGVDARVVDGQALPFAAEFDAVFSNAALHWMTEPARVIAGVWRALKPGGRFVGELGGAGNVAAITAALEAALARRHLPVPSPWFFPDAERYRTLLEAQDFRVTAIQHFPRPTPLPGDVTGWLTTFAGTFLQPVPEVERPAFLREVVTDLRPVLCNAEGQWVADYVRLRFAADKPLSAT